MQVKQGWVNVAVVLAHKLELVTQVKPLWHAMAAVGPALVAFPAKHSLVVPHQPQLEAAVHAAQFLYWPQLSEGHDVSGVPKNNQLVPVQVGEAARENGPEELPSQH